MRRGGDLSRLCYLKGVILHDGRRVSNADVPVFGDNAGVGVPDGSLVLAIIILCMGMITRDVLDWLILWIMGR